MKFTLVLLLVCIACTSHENAPRMVAEAGPSASPAQGQAEKSGGKQVPLSTDEEQAWRKRLPLPAKCPDYDPDPSDPESFGARILALTDKQTVVDARCMPGTYQPSHLVYLWDSSDNAARPLSFPVYQTKPSSKTPSRSDISELWGETEFDPASKHLKVFNKFRQTGDCGWWALYSFAGGAVKVDEFHLKTECDGKDPMNPQHWPSVSIQ